MLKISHAQCKAGRALIDMTQPDLAKAAGLGLSTVVDFERGRRQVSGEAIEALTSALQKAGIIFVAENGEGPGVRLRKVPIDHAAIADKIADLDAKAAALNHDGTPSPDNAMKAMKRAVVKNEAAKLRNKLTKAKGDRK